MKSMYYYLGVEGEEVEALPPPCECPSNAECNRGCDRFPNIWALPQADRAVGPADPSPVPGLGHSASIPSAADALRLAANRLMLLALYVQPINRAWDAEEWAEEAYQAAKAIEARSGETREAGLDPQDESAVA